MGHTSREHGFHMIVRIAPVVSKNFETIGTTGTITRSLQISEDARSSAMFLGPTTDFWRDIWKRNRGHQSQSESPGLLSTYSFDFAPKRSTRRIPRRHRFWARQIYQGRRIRILPYSGTRAQTA